MTERASPLKKKHPQQLFADFLKSRSDCYRCFYFIRYYVMQKERLLVILLSVLRVIQMLAPFAYQSDAQLQQCKAQDAGKNTGKSGTDPVSTGKPADQRNRHRSHQRIHSIGQGRIRKVAFPQTIARHATTI